MAVITTDNREFTVIEYKISNSTQVNKIKNKSVLDKKIGSKSIIKKIEKLLPRQQNLICVVMMIIEKYNK